MFNVNLSYKPLSFLRILFWYGWRPRQFSCLKFSRDLTGTEGVCCKGIILQGGQITSGLSVIGQSCLIIKGGAYVSYVHAPRQKSSLYI